ncbi:MAG: sugar ABC transporter ATP-binding protein [Alphaproteobacteria bacterium]|jgi:rhamnose transport system ATP-binding protein|nr:sugar ABC transporter ATP-binding protein [Alphaproteobacteria bacterium]
MEGLPMLIEARGISKQFGGVDVLSDVDLDLHAGEIHALLGENGAGKSTFAKILAGIHRPTRGKLRLNGQPVDVSSPIAAQKLGIALIHQEPISFPDLSVAENIVMGRQAGGLLSRVPWAKIIADARRYLDMLGVSLDVTRPMRGLSIANQQMVEIARSLASDSKLIIMDEPTAPLTPREVDTLFNIARRLREEGRTIIFISHRLEEVRMLCDRVTIFRDGAHIATQTIDSISDDEIIKLMIGRTLKKYMRKHMAAIGETALEVSNLSLPGAFEDVSFTLRRGEIIGLGGLVGAGRTDVARALFGVAPAASGQISIGGVGATINKPSEAIELGLSFVPEDRAGHGIFSTLSVEHNLTAAIPNLIAPSGFISRKREHGISSQAVDDLSIRLASLRQPIVELSGGNQQKAILARWLLTEPKILILDEPTRGIDIGVKAEFYDMIGDLAEAGRAILLISSELPELLSLCDRILVMSEGRITAEFPRETATQESIMQAAVPRTGMAA